MDKPGFDHAGFERNLAQRRLAASCCTACGALYLPPRSLCPRCYATRMEWRTLSGEGVLAAFTAISVSPPAMAAQGYTRDKPYVVGVVRLAEGPALCAQIVGANGAAPQGLRVGLPLRATFIERGGEVILAFERPPA